MFVSSLHLILLAGALADSGDGEQDRGKCRVHGSSQLQMRSIRSHVSLSAEDLAHRHSSASARALEAYQAAVQKLETLREFQSNNYSEYHAGFATRYQQSIDGNATKWLEHSWCVFAEQELSAALHAAREAHATAEARALALTSGKQVDIDTYKGVAAAALTADDHVAAKKRAEETACAGYGGVVSTPAPSPNTQNLLVGKPAALSCGPWSHYGPEYATDNVTKNAFGNLGESGLAHTCAEMNAWIQVDMGELKMLHKVVVWNGWDHCCRERINPFKVRLLDADQNQVWESDSLQMDPDIIHEAKEIPVAPASPVRYVKVQLDGHADYLHVAEIQAF